VCIRVLIVDDQPRARRSLTALLTALQWSTPSHAGEPGPVGRLPVEIVGEAANGQETIAQVAILHPDVVVMDLNSRATSTLDSSSDGIATIQIIKSGWPDVRIVVLTLYATERAAALEFGVDAFLLKGCSTHELLEAVKPGLGAT
jgi:DNA-binding NarL/FixJ family response regulator